MRGKRQVRSEKRQNVIMTIVLAIAALLAGRLVYVQAIAGPALAAAATDKRSFTTLISAPRGDIVTSDGTVLATSITTYDLILDLELVPEYTVTDDDEEVIGRGAAALAADLAPILDRDVAELGAELVGDPTNPYGRRYHVIAREVSPEMRQEVAALDIPGFTAKTNHTRTYPNGTVAGPLVGWVNDEGIGAAGLESVYSDLLTGTDGEQAYELGSGGQLIPTGSQSQTPAVAGCDIQTTLDLDIQYMAEQIITEQVEETGAEWGAVVVLDTDTGEILGLADSRPYDPNDPPTERIGVEGEMMTPALQASYEPGSTGKVLTVLSALEEGVVTPTSVIEDPYQLTVDNGQVFHDHTMHPDQLLTTAGVLAESANTGTINIGSLMSDETRYSYMERMGWTTSPGLGMYPNDGQVSPPDQWDGRTRYTTMFGQGVAVSLLQNTGVFNTIGNDGVRVEPVLVDGWTCDGEYIENERSAPEQVVSSESSQMMIRMLESVVGTGTGTLASVEGYRVAGKTGTAQTADGNGGVTATTASFVGLVPAEDPQLTIGVVIYKPQSGFFGGSIAAPVFRDVAAFALPDLGIPPSTEEADPYPLTPDEDAR